MKRLATILLGALALGACERTPPPQPPVAEATPAAAEAIATAADTLAAETPRTTVAGNPFIAPAGWSIETRPPAVILTAPEGGSRIALVDVAAPDADAAVAAAWSAYDADAKWPLKLASDLPAQDGWEQSRRYAYETSANDQRAVLAQALRGGESWTVVIYDMANAVGEKRGAQVALIFDRLLPKGYSRESFEGRKAHTLDAVRLAQLESFIEGSRAQLEVPGVAVGIVQDGKAVLGKGYGVRELAKPDTIDAGTLFMIASNTKAMTTLMLA